MDLVFFSFISSSSNLFFLSLHLHRPLGQHHRLIGFSLTWAFVGVWSHQEFRIHVCLRTVERPVKQTKNKTNKQNKQTNKKQTNKQTTKPNQTKRRFWHGYGISMSMNYENVQHHISRTPDKKLRQENLFWHSVFAYRYIWSQNLWRSTVDFQQRHLQNENTVKVWNVLSLKIIQY